MELLTIVAIINIVLCGMNIYTRVKTNGDYSGWVVAILGWVVVAIN